MVLDITTRKIWPCKIKRLWAALTVNRSNGWQYVMYPFIWYLAIALSLNRFLDQSQLQAFWFCPVQTCFWCMSTRWPNMKIPKIWRLMTSRHDDIVRLTLNSNLPLDPTQPFAEARKFHNFVEVDRTQHNHFACWWWISFRKSD